MSHSYSILKFDGLPERLADVREQVRRIVGDVDGVDDVVLVASELAGNAIRHTMSGAPGGSFVLELAEFQDAWHVRVTDQGGLTSPTSGTAADGDETGRGLPVVIALARAWGVIGDSTGRAVWAEVPFPEDAIAAEFYEGVVRDRTESALSLSSRPSTVLPADWQRTYQA